MTSYAQAGEDLALAELFGADDIGLGTYMDIGAHHPIEGSNTYYFYERGWRGLCIEPTPSNVALLQQYRPGDSVLWAAISNYEGLATFYECQSVTAVSTLDPEEARKRGDTRTYTVPVKTVASLVGDQKPPDLLSIDVEGSELEVLEGCPFADGWLPTVIIIESTVPCTLIPCHQKWEHILTDNNYRFYRSVGVNRIYVQLSKIPIYDL